MAEHEPSIGATSEWFTSPEYFEGPEPRPPTAKTEQRRALARTISSVPRLALRQKAVRRSHRLRHDNWVIGSRCRQNSFSSGTTSVLRAVFACRDEPMASAPALPEATVSGQFVQIFGRKQNPRGGDVLVKVRHR